MINKLEAWGCDTNDALERFVGDTDLYVMCMNLFVDDGSFDALGNALNTQDYKAAFEAAHTLKGVAGNVSAVPLFNCIETLTEKLRADNIDGVNEDYATIMRLREELQGVLAS